MTQNYDTVAVAETLLHTLVGLNQVGVVHAKDNKVQPQEFFASLDTASERISQLLLDRTVSGFWVGSQTGYEAPLEALLHKLNEQRGFGAVSTANASAKVYDLAF
jgi:hypothetical protein